jgi:hypothetical protein
MKLGVVSFPSTTAIAYSHNIAIALSIAPEGQERRSIYRPSKTPRYARTNLAGAGGPS